MEYLHHPDRVLRYFISSPFIYAMIVPLAFLDICTEIYHHICFPLYGIPLVKRSEYIRVDRYKLKYLKPEDRVNCAYCGYANGLMHYVTTIVAETEKYWCGIKHREGQGFRPPEHHKDFLPYGDEAAYRAFEQESEQRTQTNESI